MLGHLISVDRGVKETCLRPKQLCRRFRLSARPAYALELLPRPQFVK